ncbi:MAG: LacI family DNA-binding transcriptional regulator [Bacteroidota bacterium]
MARITIKDLARLLDLNPSTISRALKDHPDISIETRKKVQQLAEELGYSPNFQAIHFRNRQSGLIALIFPAIHMFFLPSIISAIEKKAREKGYNLLVLHSNDSFEKERENVNLCQQVGVDGIIASLASDTESITHFKDVIKSGIPVVFFDRVNDSYDAPMVIIDDADTAFRAVSELTQKGRQKICGVFGAEKLPISQKRKEGYKNALKAAGLTYSEQLIIHTTDPFHARSAVFELLKSDIPPDGIFIMSDRLLLGVSQALHQARIKIPEDLSVISFSEGYIAKLFHPRISYLEHSGEQVGRAAVNLMFDIIQGNDKPQNQKIFVPVNLVSLGSV